ncbi:MULTISPECIES: erythromycin esterase family protein [unclassified Cellulophaga]|uniref:erythromycin esterase family protein n=1 Tax=unclassified Cellulophaga TaxID=2634405 RepID=UPI0026E1AB53|nr:MULTISPECIES: erythromycin esterase family protein [unclassified Cellulophaga]MDO6489906.1 erythromycin esterase family protein [Cellulophaga sp. 2_MG-2023]MDO6494900.1 erythromycin esterase family protein [Cellulophaga sp. 3_MG-2023]
MKNIILTIIFITFSNSTVFGQENSIVEILDENAFEIQETNPKIEFNKSDKLDSIFENVRIFGFGEATHGTKEFFDLKIKFFKYLVKNQGVKNFAIEASFGNCIEIDNFIKGKDADPRKLIRKMGYWIWNNEEVLSLIEWMKKYNIGKKKSEQLNFYGVDIMDATNSAKLMLDLVKKNNIKNNEGYLNTLVHYQSRKKSENLKKEELKKHLEIMFELKQYIIKTNIQSKKLYLGIQNSLIQYINFRLDFNQENRDKGMSENVSQIINTSENNSKVFVWTHNFHVKKNKITYTNDFSMGHFLKEKYGEKYYSIGFDFATGNFYAINPKKNKIEKYTIKKPLKNTSSELFSKSNLRIFFFDFNSISKNKLMNEFLNTKIKYRGIGSTYSPKMVEKEKLLNAYDGIIFVNKTNESTYLRK